jgi:hypothetical protein
MAAGEVLDLAPSHHYLIGFLVPEEERTFSPERERAVTPMPQDSSLTSVPPLCSSSRASDDM